MKEIRGIWITVTFAMHPALDELEQPQACTCAVVPTGRIAAGASYLAAAGLHLLPIDWLRGACPPGMLAGWWSPLARSSHSGGSATTPPLSYWWRVGSSPKLWSCMNHVVYEQRSRKQQSNREQARRWTESEQISCPCIVWACFTRLYTCMDA
jgi:hypothetical protein